MRLTAPRARPTSRANPTRRMKQAKAVRMRNPGAYTLANTYTPGHTSHSVHKVWKDYGDSSKRPKAVYATLYANGQPTGKTVALSDDNNWQYTFTDLDENKVYTVKETNEKGETISGVDGYCQPVINDDKQPESPPSPTPSPSCFPPRAGNDGATAHFSR